MTEPLLTKLVKTQTIFETMSDIDLVKSEVLDKFS